MENKTTLYCVRVMFEFDDKPVVNFKIITDTEVGIKQFIESLKSLDNILRIAVEYLNEYDCSKLGIINKVFDKGGE